MRVRRPVVAVASIAGDGVACRWSEFYAEEIFAFSRGDVFVLDTTEVGQDEQEVVVQEWWVGSLFRQEHDDAGGWRLVYVAGEVWVRAMDLMACEERSASLIQSFVHNVRLLSSAH